MHIKNLERIRNIDWLKYITGVAGLGANITENDDVIVKHPEYLVSIVRYLYQTSVR